MLLQKHKLNHDSEQDGISKKLRNEDEPGDSSSMSLHETLEETKRANVYNIYDSINLIKH